MSGGGGGWMDGRVEGGRRTNRDPQSRPVPVHVLIAGLIFKVKLLKQANKV